MANLATEPYESLVWQANMAAAKSFVSMTREVLGICISAKDIKLLASRLGPEIKFAFHEKQSISGEEEEDAIQLNSIKLPGERDY